MNILPVNPLSCETSEQVQAIVTECTGSVGFCNTVTSWINSGFITLSTPDLTTSACDSFNFNFNLFATFAVAMIPIMALLRLVTRS